MWGDLFLFVRLASNMERRFVHWKILQGAFVVGYFLEVAVLKLITTKHNIFRMPKHLAHVD